MGQLARVDSHPPVRVAGPRARDPYPSVGVASAAHVRLHRGGGPADHRADGRNRCRAAGSNGLRHSHRGALREATAAVRLLHAGFRAGDQSAAGLDSRVSGDLHQIRSGARAESAHGDAVACEPGDPGLARHRQCRVGEDPSHRSHARFASHGGRLGALSCRRRCSGHGGPTRRAVRRG